MDRRINLYKNPFKRDEFCKLRSQRKYSYYQQADLLYKPQLYEYDQLHRPELMNTIFKMDPYSQTTYLCNCVSFILYTTGQPNTLITYLVSLDRSIKNIEENLPDWIVRIYIDINVYSFIKYISDENNKYMDIIKYFNLIINGKNVEVYTIECKSDTDNRSTTRIYRFLPLLDETEYENGIYYGINVCAVREADGIVSNLDCRNLYIFSQEEDVKKIFYLIPFFYENCHMKGYCKTPYSRWLAGYQNYIRPDFFKNKNNLFDLLAGCFACKLKVRDEYFYEKIKFISDFSLEHNIELNEGFDERLLLELFKDIISTSYDNIKNESEEYFIILDSIHERHNINTIYLSWEEDYIDTLNKQEIIYIDVDDQGRINTLDKEVMENIQENGVKYKRFIIDSYLKRKYWNMNNMLISDIFYYEPIDKKMAYNGERNILSLVNEPYIPDIRETFRFKLTPKAKYTLECIDFLLYNI